MNRDEPEKIDQTCNVCGSRIEVGSAWSRCSNRDCITRDTDGLNEPPYDGLPSVSTDATGEELLHYWELRALKAQEDGPRQNDIDSAAKQKLAEYMTAEDPNVLCDKKAAVNALLPFSSYDGWGELKEADP